MWPVTNVAVINEVRAALRSAPIFIADGHHRYETANTFRNWLIEQGQHKGETDPSNFVLMMLVGMSDPGLAILPTHRLVTGFPNLTADDLARALAPNLSVESVGRGVEAAERVWKRIELDDGQDVFGFGTAADGVWSFARVIDASPMAKLAADQSDDWRKLGVSLLHKLVIDDLLKRAYPKASPQFKYVHLLDEATEAIASKGCDLACLVPPARIEHVEAIASKFEKMPPKSTYFYPKLLSGLVFNPLERT
jgi:uncharacterized protein (DUF1015 family)